jgi:SAM-dependent methyltransferase
VTGYVTDTTYADTFFRELSPAWLNYVAALNGIAPRSLQASFRYLELGSGFGSSSVINAAAFPQASFDACDLNPVHVDGGRAYAAQLGVGNITFHAIAFDDLLARLPGPYDFVVLHGVYSWVDARTRQVLREIIARLLAPGGLLYVSYNALPGWSAELPLRRLLVELAASEHGTAAERADGAVATIDALRKTHIRYFPMNPAAASAVEAYVRGDGPYLAHEFMNAAWEPFYAVDVADEFAAIGLQFAGSATLASNHLPLVLDGATAEAIGRLPTARQQHLAVDFATNQRFRRDVFVRPDGSPRSALYLQDAPVGCVTAVDEIGTAARVPRGEVRLQEPFVHDVRALFAQGSATFGDAVERLSRVGEDASAIARNVLFLIAAGVLAPFASALTITAPPTRLANQRIERALEAPAHAGRRVIPSSVYGNGVEVDEETVRALDQWRRGRPVAPEFLTARLPTLSRLGIVC